MNIFVVDESPYISARSLCDKHVVKMIVEGCQMLSTIHRMANSHMFHYNVDFYKMSFINHPCTIWARTSWENYMWLAHHTHALSVEYTHRYKKIHKASELSEWFCKHPLNFENYDLTPFAQAMPDKYKSSNAVEAYRNYYIHEKARFAKWKFTSPPDWFVEGVKNVHMPVLQS